MFILNLRFRNHLPVRTTPQPVYNMPGQGGVNIYGNNNNIFIGGQPRFTYDGFVGQPVQAYPVYAPVYAPTPQYGYGGYGTPYGYGAQYGYGGGLPQSRPITAMDYLMRDGNGNIVRLPNGAIPIVNPWENGPGGFGDLIRNLGLAA